MADTFPYLLTSDRMQELLLQRLGVTYLNGVISSSAIKDTSFFVLTVESPSPQDAYDILCAVIDVYPQVNRLVLGETQLVVNQEPSLPDAPYNADPWVRSAVKGAALGVVLALAVLIVGVANVVTVVTTRDRVVTVEGAATALAGDAADAVGAGNAPAVAASGDGHAAGGGGVVGGAHDTAGVAHAARGGDRGAVLAVLDGAG